MGNVIDEKHSPFLAHIEVYLPVFWAAPFRWSKAHAQKPLGVFPSVLCAFCFSTVSPGRAEDRLEIRGAPVWPPETPRMLGDTLQMGRGEPGVKERVMEEA